MDIYNISEIEGQQLLEAATADILRKRYIGEITHKGDDLARLYKSVRERKPFQFLEFSSGFSIIIMASALKQNWE